MSGRVNDDIRMDKRQRITAVTASVARNLRECEDGMATVGRCAAYSCMASGDWLACVDTDSDGQRIIAVNNNRVYYRSHIADGVVQMKNMLIHSATSAVRCVVSCGKWLVVSTDNGLVAMIRTSAGYEERNKEALAPGILIETGSQITTSEDIEPYTFINPLTHWNTVSAADAAAFSSVVRSSARAMMTRIADSGHFCRPMMARVAVRLSDDTYAWLGAPTLIGENCLNVQYSSAEAVVEDGKYVGWAASALQMKVYKPSIRVLSAFGAEWDDIVKSVDILVSEPSSPFSLSGNIDLMLRTSTASGVRRQYVEYALMPVAKQAVAVDLATKDSWRLYSCCTNFTLLRAGAWTGVSAVSKVVVNDSQVEKIHRNIRQNSRYGSLKSYEGRLMAVGIDRQARVAWNASAYMRNAAESSCTASVSVRLSTSSGIQTIVRKAILPVFSSQLSPIIVIPDSRAVHITIVAQANGVTYKWQNGLMPVSGMDIAVSIDPTLTGFTMEQCASETIIDRDGEWEGFRDEIDAFATLNPFVREQSSRAPGADVVDVVSVGKPLYSGGFGHYPLYVLTRQGVYALPQKMGDARLVSYYRIKNGSRGVEGADCAYFVSDTGYLCRISGSAVATQGLSNADELAWCDYHKELWLLGADGVQVVMASGRRYWRSEAISHLWHRAIGSWAHDNSGKAYVLAQETDAQQAVEWLSHAIVLSDNFSAAVRAATWNVIGDGSATLTLLAERGASCHGRIVNRVVATGHIAAPIRLPIRAMTTRTLRLHLQGTLSTATILRPTVVMTDD